jgi:signal transduction histidine kinase
MASETPHAPPRRRAPSRAEAAPAERPTSAPRRMIRQLGTDTGYNLIGLVAAVASFSVILTFFVLGVSTLAVTIGLPILALTMLIARGFADLHRLSLRSVVRRPSPRPLYSAPPANAGWFRRLINPLTSGQSWLDLVAGLIDLPFAITAFVFTVVWWCLALGGITYGLWDWTLPTDQHQANGIVVNNESLAEVLGFGASSAARIGVNEGVGVFFLLTLPLVVRLAALARAHVNRALLCGVAEMRREITGLQMQKQAAASAEANALRRLERDIHDGPQQRLVRLAMDLGRARQQLDRDPEAARATIDEALGQTRETLDELRALSRGIAPPILTDRGLPSALAALAGRCPVPVDLAINPERGRLEAGIDSAAYFVTAESLTNVAKHSRASTCAVTVARAPGRLGITIADDGVGGASVAKGHGLAGLTDRVHAAGGTLHVTSPNGGPTQIRAEIPCA